MQYGSAYGAIGRTVQHTAMEQLAVQFRTRRSTQQYGSSHLRLTSGQQRGPRGAEQRDGLVEEQRGEEVRVEDLRREGGAE